MMLVSSTPSAPRHVPRQCTTPRPSRGVLLRVRASGGQEESTESLFMKELKRRGIENTTAQSTEEKPSVRMAPPFAEDAPPPPREDDQLSKSRSLNSEGLEGLIPRATELVRLGGGFFLAFGPFIAVISLVFSIFYLVLGDSFVHGGSPVSAPPPYVDPYDLLNEPTVDPMVPLR